MRETDLPSPNTMGGQGYHLRRVAAQVISSIQIVASKYPDGRHPQALLVKQFFDACSAAVATFVPLLIPVVTFTPTAKTYSIAAGAAQAGPTLAKGGSTGAASYVSSDPTKATVNAATGAVTPLVAGTTTITVSIAADATYAAATQTYVATVTA